MPLHDWSALPGWDGVHQVWGVELLYAPRTATLSFTLRGHLSEAVAVALAGRGVFVSNGDFYATTIVERLGVADGGLVRVGCACYTTADEIDRLVAGVRELARPVSRG